MTDRCKSSITLGDSYVVNWEIRNCSSERVTHRDGISGSHTSSPNLSVLSQSLSQKDGLVPKLLASIYGNLVPALPYTLLITSLAE